MDIQFLESFLAVVEYGSIAAAARRLNLTSAAIAQRLRVLESEFGRQLVTRAGRTVIPTAAGAAIIENVTALVRDAENIKSLAAEEAVTGELRVGAISTALTGILPAAFQNLSLRCPNLDIFVRPGTSIDLYRLLIEGGLDATMAVEPPFSLPKGFRFQLVGEEELVLIAPNHSAEQATLSLLADQPFIRYDRNNWGGRLIDVYLRQLAVPLRERFELDSLEAIAVFVERGLGVSIVPNWVPPWPAGLSLVKRALTDAPVRRVGMMWSRTSLKLRAIRALLAELGG